MFHFFAGLLTLTLIQFSAMPFFYLPSRRINCCASAEGKRSELEVFSFILWLTVKMQKPSDAQRLHFYSISTCTHIWDGTMWITNIRRCYLRFITRRFWCVWIWYGEMDHVDGFSLAFESFVSPLALVDTPSGKFAAHPLLERNSAAIFGHYRMQ